MLKSTRPTNPEDFSISVNGIVYTDKKDGGKSLTDALYSGKVNVPVAEYCGFKISMNPMSIISHEREITLSAEGQYVIAIADSASGNLTRIENFLNDLPEREERLKKKLLQLNADLEVAKEQVEKPFEHAEQLRAYLSEQAELNSELNLDKRDDVIVADENDNGDSDNNYRALPDIQKQNKEVNMIDEEDKVAAMQVDLLPDYAVTNEDMHTYGYLWDGMLPVTGSAAKTLSKLGLQIYELRSNDTEAMADDTSFFDVKDIMFGVEKPEWLAFLRSDYGRCYISARRDILKSVLASLDGEDMLYFANTEREKLCNMGRKYLRSIKQSATATSVADMKKYALPVFDEQVEKLKKELPFDEHGWSEADIHLAVYGNIEDEELKNVLSRHGYEMRLNAFLDKELTEFKFLNCKTTGFTKDEIVDISNDLKPAFENSEFALLADGESYDDWYDCFVDDELIPLLNQRALSGEEYYPQYEDNPLGLPPLDDELTVLAVQPDTGLNETQTLKGAALIKNEVVDDWYVLGCSKDGKGNELKAGDKTNLEQLGISVFETDPNIIRSFKSEQEAQDFYNEKVQVHNSVKENYERKEPDYEDEVIRSVNAEFEAYKADVLSRSPEEIFHENYKIHVFTELKGVISEGVEDENGYGYLDIEHYKALYEERGGILNALFDDFVSNEYASVHNFEDTSEFIKDYCERFHLNNHNGENKQSDNLDTAEYATENTTDKSKEEIDLAVNKYLKETSRGDKVLSITQDKSGRNIAVVQRKKDFTVAIGYDVTDGTWAQGVYDFNNEKAANDYREKYYGETSEPKKKWYEIFVSKDALIKTYEKSSLMRMPSSNTCSTAKTVLPALTSISA